MMKNKIGLYVHIPFCVRKCNYCDFLSAPATDAAMQDYCECLCREMAIWGENFPKETWEADTIFVGGGTPSILSMENSSYLMENLYKHFPICEDAEISWECNPATVTMDKLLQYRKLGINRLSIGMQSTIDKELQNLGRLHSYDDFVKTYTMAREAGFENINIDIMAAIPEQTEESYGLTLQRVLQHNPEHISSYSLIIEEGTPFYEKYRHEPPVDEDTDRRLYEKTAEKLDKNGYARYEISNYAKPGFACKHNLKYWRGNEYIGLGLGASSYFEGKRFSNERDLKIYKSVLQKGEKPIAETETLTERDKMAEFMYLGLRCMEGVSEEQFCQQFQTPLQDVYGDVIDKYEKQGLLIRKNGWIMLTNQGIDVSNMVFADFL